MGYSSPLLTPECTDLRPEVVEASTPWSDILLEELRTAIRFEPQSPIRRYGVATGRSCRTRLRNQSRILSLAILVLVSLLWATKRGKNTFSNKSKLVSQPGFDGLQFLNASNPSIRVRQLLHLIKPILTVRQYVGRWVSTADGTHKDGSFPGSIPASLGLNPANSCSPKECTSILP
jgi:hypothetical protein